MKVLFMRLEEVQNHLLRVEAELIDRPLRQRTSRGFAGFQTWPKRASCLFSGRLDAQLLFG